MINSSRIAQRVTQIVYRLFILVCALYVTRYTLHVSPVFAQYGQYGGEVAPVQSILIDKQVGKPNGTTTKGGTVQVEYVDNLTPSDVRFRPGMEVNFRIKVKNTSQVVLTSVIVTDKVPVYVEPIEGPGTFDSGNRTISFDAGGFAPDQEKVFFLKMQLYGQDKLPADKGLMCITNYAKASTGNTVDDDTAQFCIEKEVIGVKQAPKAGPEMGILLLAGQLGLLGFGITLKRKSANG